MKLDFSNKKKPGEPDKLVAQIKTIDVEHGRQLMDSFKLKTGKMFNKVENFEVKSNEDMATMTEMVGQAKDLAGQIEKAAKAIYDPYYQFYKKMLNLKNTVIDPLKRIPGIGQKKTNDYAYQVEMDRRAKQAEADRKAKAFQAKLDAEAKKKNVRPVVVPVPLKQVIPEKQAPIKTESGTMSIGMVWDAQLTDMEDPGLLEWVLRLAPMEYKKALEKVMKVALRDGVREGIPGVRFFERAETKHRRR